jgi:hypothetical protein
MKRRQPRFFSTVLLLATAGCQPKTTTPPQCRANSAIWLPGGEAVRTVCHSNNNR